MNMNASTTGLAPSPAKAISIRDVNLFYGDLQVLKDINLEIQPGEFFAFLGPSGCGKTTLLRLIAGFNTARQGSVVVGGVDVLDMPPWKRDIGMVFQSYALWPHMTVARNVAFGLEERRLPRAEVERRVDAALNLVGLKHLAGRRPAQLSGGQQQRVALARTIAIEPKVLLLDEPLSNLDAKMRVEVRRELRELQQRLQLTTIFVTHDQEEANTVCDRIAVFNEGRIQQVGTPMGLYEKPANLFVANFLGTANILDGHVVGSGADRLFEVPGAGSIPIPAGTTVPRGAKLVFRPQYATIGTVASDAVALAGTITHREFLGATVRYGVQVGTASVLVDVPFHSGDALLETGARTSVGLQPSSAQWLAE
ncbi:iron(III) transport system ATP-binding protein [Aminobacter ciceronei]|jgi:iron(III) transport system ATP-binding protein|uniref:ATP-binding component of ABC transporter n=3 Tax=Phyllobacteriaceae TaxID=69277 RepID=A0AAC8YV61_AMIAI|nr:Putative ATP-binding component of ABC transporter [Aminobacter aminovorans]MBA8906913.1 iron(III) transport system ATP-binding protein [Aminobacter ciceronei]MBA9020829.1 iron(III) transport system ATP-binding protein [Aminobacter ciceronei]MBB3708389.1 iron(III) transport system ATP-binding protein [Aminobacter aminovorans]QOF74695.1 ABC transporter ATP-binding protein [Aminobacter sp. SR38]